MTTTTQDSTLKPDDSRIKHPRRLVVGLLIGAIILGIMAFIVSRSPAVAHADTDLRTELTINGVGYSSRDIQATFSDYARSLNRSADWPAINGGPDSSQNIASMTQLRKIMPLAMVEGQAFELADYWRTHPSGIEMTSPDREGCLIGALTRGYLLRNNLDPATLAQPEFNRMQALVDVQVDPIDYGKPVSEGLNYLRTHTVYPPSVAGFGDPFLGTGGIGKGATACFTTDMQSN